MDLPFLLGQRPFFFAMSNGLLEPLLIGVVIAMTLAFMWWVRHITGEREYRSFRATTHPGSRQAVVAIGVTMGLTTALILVAPVIGRLLRA